MIGFFMNRYKWESIWYTGRMPVKYWLKFRIEDIIDIINIWYGKRNSFWKHYSPVTLKHMLSTNLLLGSWFVGTWTGPQRDLICLKECKTNKEANKWLSPAGKTILSATLKAVWKYHKLKKCGK